MAQQANISSVEALATFRAQLIVFITSAHNSLDNSGDELRRMRQWLQHDQRARWELELRKRQRALDLAEQELFSARLSGLRDSTTRQQEMVRRAQRAVSEAEEKLRNIKKWARDFEAATDPLNRRLQQLRDLLDHTLPKGLSFLLQAQTTLEAYASPALKRPSGSTESTPSTESTESTEEPPSP